MLPSAQMMMSSTVVAIEVVMLPLVVMLPGLLVVMLPGLLVVMLPAMLVVMLPAMVAEAKNTVSNEAERIDLIRFISILLSKER